MKTPPVFDIGVRHVIVYHFDGDLFLQFRDGPHMINSWKVTEAGLREGTWDPYVQAWNSGQLGWNAICTIAKKIRSELSH